MFHDGVETQPLEFYQALKRSMGVAIVGAIVPFTVSFGMALMFGLDLVGATFVGLTMTATAVVITLKSLKDLGLANTRVALIIIASCVIDDLLTLVFFGLVIGVLSGGTFEPLSIVITLGKVLVFIAVAVILGRFVYPRLTLPFRSERAGEIILDIPPLFVLAEDDGLYVCGTVEAINRHHVEFSAAG